MRSLLLLATVLAACQQQPPAPGEPGREEAPGVARAWNFDGERPALSVATGEWRIVADSKAPSPPQVLAQEASNDEALFNVALLDGTSYRDLELNVKLKAVSGEYDQGGGLVWRATDAENYYIARYNPLEYNFRLYKVVDGDRSQLASAKAEPTPGWITLRVRMKGDAIECELDGKVRLEARDATFRDAGRIGFWTKADAVTQFDDLSVR